MSNFNQRPQEWDLITTWAQLPDPTTCPGAIATVTDVGQGRTRMFSNGTNWRVQSSTDIVFTTTSVDSDLTGTDQVLAVATLPNGILRAGRSFEVKALFGRDGSTDDAVCTVRVGSTGTTADPVLLTTPLLTKTNRSLAVEQLLILTSATNARVIASQGGTEAWDGVARATPYPIDVTIPSADSGTVRVSASVQMSGTTDVGHLHTLIVTLYP